MNSMHLAGPVALWLPEPVSVQFSKLSILPGLFFTHPQVDVVQKIHSHHVVVVEYAANG
jgi:hypothetical protein